MKTLTFFIIALFLGITASAQTPQSFRYQAVARDNSGNVLENQPVSFKISILSGSVSGTVAYSETHPGLSTNAFGLVELEIGKGTTVTGTFSTVNWVGNSYFVKVEMDPAGGTAYQVLSASQLLSVPYALHAKTVEQISDKSVTGSKLAPMDATNGQALKWNGTTWAPADDIGSLWQQSGNNIYYNNGYAGIGTSSPQMQLHINTWGVFSGILMTNDASGTTLDDGLRIGLQYQGDAPNNRYALILNKENSKLIIGTNNNNAGDLTILPGGNTGLGTSTPSARLDVDGQIRIRGGSSGTGKVLTSDAIGLASWQTPVANPWQKIDDNLFYNAGYVGIGTSVITYHPLTIENNSNTCYIKMRDNQGTGGVRIGADNGDLALMNDNVNENIRFSIRNSSGYFQMMTIDAVNKRVGILTTTPNASLDVRGTIQVSGRAGFGTTSPSAGLHLKGTGFPESFMYLESNTGQDAGIRLYDGSTVKWHIFNNSALAGLQIYNNSGNDAIFCKQSNSFVGLGTTSPTQKLHVVGNAYKTEGGNTWASSSDLRLKTILGNYEKGLNEIAALQPVRFRYLDNNPRELSSDIEQVGFVAQDVRKIFPEAVSEAEDGYLDFNIHAVNVAIINAVKELKAENESLKADNEKIVSENASLSNRLEKIEALMGITNAKKTGNPVDTTNNLGMK